MPFTPTDVKKVRKLTDNLSHPFLTQKEECEN